MKIQNYQTCGACLIIMFVYLDFKNFIICVGFLRFCTSFSSKGGTKEYSKVHLDQVSTGLLNLFSLVLANISQKCLSL